MCKSVWTAYLQQVYNMSVQELHSLDVQRISELIIVCIVPFVDFSNLLIKPYVLTRMSSGKDFTWLKANMPLALQCPAYPRNHLNELL